MCHNHLKPAVQTGTIPPFPSFTPSLTLTQSIYLSVRPSVGLSVNLSPSSVFPIIPSRVPLLSFMVWANQDQEPVCVRGCTQESKHHLSYTHLLHQHHHHHHPATLFLYLPSSKPHYSRPACLLVCLPACLFPLPSCAKVGHGFLSGRLLPTAATLPPAHPSGERWMLGDKPARLAPCPAPTHFHRHTHAHTQVIRNTHTHTYQTL